MLLCSLLLFLFLGDSVLAYGRDFITFLDGDELLNALSKPRFRRYLHLDGSCLVGCLLVLLVEERQVLVQLILGFCELTAVLAISHQILLAGERVTFPELGHAGVPHFLLLLALVIRLVDSVSGLPLLILLVRELVGKRDTRSSLRG